MIFIDLFSNPPLPELIAEGEQFTEQLMQLPPAQRDDFIDRHEIIGENSRIITRHYHRESVGIQKLRI